MIIRVEELRARQKVIEFDFVVEKMEDLKLAAPLSIEGTAESRDGQITVHGRYSAEVLMSCVRCLKDIKIHLARSFEGNFVDSQTFREYTDSLGAECEMDEMGLEEAVDSEIDINKLVREHIILELPPFPVCDPECSGLEEMEKYADDGVDLRWQGLLKLKS